MPARPNTITKAAHEQALADLNQERELTEELLARAIDAETRLARGREAWREENARCHVLEAALAAATAETTVAA